MHKCNYNINALIIRNVLLVEKEKNKRSERKILFRSLYFKQILAFHHIFALLYITSWALLWDRKVILENLIFRENDSVQGFKCQLIQFL